MTPHFRSHACAQNYRLEKTSVKIHLSPGTGDWRSRLLCSRHCTWCFTEGNGDTIILIYQMRKPRLSLQCSLKEETCPTSHRGLELCYSKGRCSPGWLSPSTRWRPKPWRRWDVGVKRWSPTLGGQTREARGLVGLREAPQHWAVQGALEDEHSTGGTSSPTPVL